MHSCFVKIDWDEFKLNNKTVGWTFVIYFYALKVHDLIFQNGVRFKWCVITLEILVIQFNWSDHLDEWRDCIWLQLPTSYCVSLIMVIITSLPNSTFFSCKIYQGYREKYALFSDTNILEGLKKSDAISPGSFNSMESIDHNPKLCLR